MKKYIIILLIIILVIISTCRNNNQELIIRKSIKNNFYGFTNYSILDYSILDKVNKTGILKIGFSEEISPFIYSDDDIYKGYTIDLLYEITKDLEIEFKIEKIPPEELLNALLLKNIDIGIPNFYNTKQREYIIDYSIPYFIGGIRLLTEKGKNVNSFEDLSGKTIGIIDTSNTNIENQLREQIDNIYLYKIDNIQDIERLFNNNVINAYAGTTLDIIRIINHSEDYINYTILNEKLDEIPYSFLLIENDSGWRDFVNNNIQILFEDDTIKSIYNLYFKESARINLPFDWKINKFFVINE